MSAQLTVAIVDCGSSKVPDIAQLLEDLDAQPRVILASELPAVAATPPAAIIISGNPQLIENTGSGFLVDFEPLRKLGAPLLGICFGHQVIGMLHGAEVTTGKEDRGLRRLQLLHQSRLFNGLSGNELYQQDHIEQVAVPENFIHLAASSHCHNEAMMHRDLPVYGVQFHPEGSAAAGRQLMQNFLALASDEGPAA